MEEKTIAIGEQFVSYSEKNTQNQSCIFFIHGNSNSSQVWQNQFEDTTFDRYHLIAIDLPGHGNSSWLDSDDEYSVIAMASIVFRAFTILCDKKSVVICGFSLGTNIVAEMLAYSIKACGLILISPCIVGSKVKLGDLNDKQLVADVLYTAMPEPNLVEGYFQIALSEGHLKEQLDLKQQYLKTDPKFRKALIETAYKGLFSDEIALLNNSNFKALMIIGEGDKIVVPDLYDVPDLLSSMVQITKIKQVGHFPQLEEPTEVNCLMADYLSVAFKDNPVSSHI